ncbi:MAG: SOS response-associated peptidase [Bacteroidota bacterium]|jgi:putative SOS response-associated peptidase YedK
MCYHTKQTKNLRQVEQRFKAKAEQPEIFNDNAIYNGFTFPVTPVILDIQPGIIKQVYWGLIPEWSNDENIRSYTLNAKIETLLEKPSFRNYVNKRCLIIADGFFEWQWLDDTGKKKQKFLIQSTGQNLFSLAGLYAEWTDKNTGEIRTTYTIVTTEANELMEKIHNHKKRMPVVLTEENEGDWINGRALNEFFNPQVNLYAEMV